MADLSKLMDKGSEAIDRGNFDYAISLFKQVVALEPNNIKARNGLYLATAKKAEAQGTFGKTNFFKSFLPSLKIFLFKTTKKLELLMKTCEEYLLESPGDVKVRLQLAQALRLAEYLEASLTEYQIVMGIDHENVDAAKALGELFTIKGDAKQAQTYFNVVLKKNPTDREMQKAIRDLAALGSITTSKLEDAQSSRDLIKDKDKAAQLEKEGHSVKTDEDIQAEIDVLVKEIEAHPKNPDNVKPWKKIGEYYFTKLKKYKEAIEAYQKALDLSPFDNAIKNKIGDIKISQYDQTLAELEKQLKQNPNEASLKAKVVAIKKEKLKLQIDDFRQRVKERPTDYVLRFELGKILMQGSLYEEAIGEFQQAVKDPKRKFDALNNLGLCFIQKKVYDLAIAQFQKALEMHPPEQDMVKLLIYNLATAYDRQGNKQKALEEYKKILEVDYGYRDVAKKVEALTSPASAQN